MIDDFSSYFKYTFSLKPLESAIEKKYLFDDANGNGYHDYSTTGFDFPFPDSVSASPEKRVKDIHNPNGFKLGINKSFGEKIALAFEIGTLNDIAENQDNFLSTLSAPISNWIEKTNSLKASFSYFPENYSLRFFDKFSFKSGLIHHIHTMKYDEMDIEELGFSFGIGFKFKPVGNQINLNYYIGNRKYSSISEKEFIAEAVKKTFVGIINIDKIERKPSLLNKLVIGLECGGSDGFSGISANPTLGLVSDIIVALGGRTILSEFPELNGVEKELIKRCNNLKNAEKFVSIMQSYKNWAEKFESGFFDNPSPGNIKDGLITCLLYTSQSPRD